MKRSRAISVQIARPFEEVYAFLAEPANLVRWALVEDERMTPLGGRDYLLEVSGGQRVLRLIEPNPYGVLDYWVFAPGTDPGPAIPTRLVPNGEGCELTIWWLQRKGDDDVEFESEADWLSSDLGVLKSVLEA